MLRLAREISLAHREGWDGSGYPHRLKCAAIPLSGRIVARRRLDALTHERSYEAAWRLEDAVAEVAGLAGRRFDPALVAAFESLDHELLVAPTG